MIEFSYSNDTSDLVKSYPYPLFQPYKPLCVKMIEKDIKPKYEYYLVVQNISFFSIMSPFKAKNDISHYTSFPIKSDQLYSNSLFLKNSPCKTLVKISTF